MDAVLSARYSLNGETAEIDRHTVGGNLDPVFAGDSRDVGRQVVGAGLAYGMHSSRRSRKCLHRDCRLNLGQGLHRWRRSAGRRETASQSGLYQHGWQNTESTQYRKPFQSLSSIIH